jgi:hypothetical protein
MGNGIKDTLFLLIASHLSMKGRICGYMAIASLLILGFIQKLSLPLVIRSRLNILNELGNSLT